MTVAVHHDERNEDPCLNTSPFFNDSALGDTLWYSRTLVYWLYTKASKLSINWFSIV